MKPVAAASPSFAPDLSRPRRSPALMRCDQCPIRDRAVCAYCDDAGLERLSAIKSYRDVPAGRDILAAGGRSETVASIVRGVVKLTKSLPDGRAQMVGLLFPGDFVGHPGQERAEFDATAAIGVLLCQFPRQPFEALLRENPALEKRLLDMTLSELDAARDWLLLLGRKTARERIATFLLALIRRSGAPEGGDVALPLTRGEIAEYLGLTIETVSRHMTRLRGDGVIDFDNARAVRSACFARLAQEAGDETVSI
jgi:CRP/FNR family transcriptional regulator